MGVGLSRNSVGDFTPPNPNPKDFEIKKLISIDEKYTLVIVKYNGCATYNGEKIAIYKAHPNFILKADVLDPHFLENNLSPIARFPASVEGEHYAMQFLKMISG
jgi:hypothetical protein